MSLGFTRDCLGPFGVVKCQGLRSEIRKKSEDRSPNASSKHAYTAILNSDCGIRPAFGSRRSVSELALSQCIKGRGQFTHIAGT